MAENRKNEMKLIESTFNDYKSEPDLDPFTAMLPPVDSSVASEQI